MTTANYFGLAVSGSVRHEGYGGWNSLQPPGTVVEIDTDDDGTPLLEIEDPAEAWCTVAEALAHYLDSTGTLEEIALWDMLDRSYIEHSRRGRLPEWARALVAYVCEAGIKDALRREERKDWPPEEGDCQA